MAPKSNIQLASSVARFVEIESVSLQSASFKSSTDPLALPESLRLENRYRAWVDRRSKEAGDQLYVHVVYDFEAIADPPVGDRVDSVAINAEFLVVYSLSPKADFDADALPHFAEVNGAYNSWPYWRELVQNMASRTGFSAMVLAVFRPEVKPVESSLEHGATGP